MSIGQLLTTVRDHLSTALNLTKDECGVQLSGTPPAAAGQRYVAVDEGGVNVYSGDEAWLGEQYTILVSIMRRAGQYPADRQGDLLVRETTAIKSLEELERRTIEALHGNELLRKAYNEALGVPNDYFGEIAIQPLWYRGRGRTFIFESPLDEPNFVYAWWRRDLRFSGMNRKQKPENIG